MMFFFKWSIMLIAIVIVLPLCLNSKATAFSIIIKNETDVSLRIDLLEDDCGNVLIEETNPVSLLPGESIKFENVVLTVHHYKMCANGTCEGSSLGMKINKEQYFMIARLKNRCLCITQKPLIWPGVIRCDKLQYRI